MSSRWILSSCTMRGWGDYGRSSIASFGHLVERAGLLLRDSRILSIAGLRCLGNFAIKEVKEGFQSIS